MSIADHKVGEVFEIDGVHYVVVDHGRQHPKAHERMAPQPADVGEEYIHADGQLHVCKNPTCPKLVLRTKNPGKTRIYCGPRCNRVMQQRKHDAKRGEGMGRLLYDPLQRLYAVVMRMPPTADRAKAVLDKHLEGTEERCPEASEPANFTCPAVYNPRSYHEAKWQSWNEKGVWPGACLLAAVLKDNYRVLYYRERGQTTDREFTKGQGEQFRWKEEETMLPMPQGVVRP
jgi:hypothetical protein